MLCAAVQLRVSDDEVLVESLTEVAIKDSAHAQEVLREGKNNRAVSTRLSVW